MEVNNLAEKDRTVLFHAFHEIVGFVNLMWKEKSLKEGMLSELNM